MFTLIPVVFNVLIWQNYPISSECLLPEFLRGSPISLIGFGLAFGLFTALAANFCLLFALSFGSVLKNQKINRHFLRHQKLYAALWAVAFTLSSFAGFVAMICFRDPHAATASVYFSGVQGFLTAGFLATSPAILVAGFCVALRNRMAPFRVEAVRVAPRAGEQQ